MDPKQRRQFYTFGMIFAGMVLMILMANNLWGVIFLLLVGAATTGAAMYMRRTGRWKTGKMTGRMGLWITIGVVLLLLILALTVGVGFYVDWLWFSEVGFLSVFTTRIIAQVLLFVGATVVVTLLLGTTMRLALRWQPPHWGNEAVINATGNETIRKVGSIVTWCVAAFFGLIFGAAAQGEWMNVLRFLNAGTVGQADPLFGRDLGFYLFQLRLLLDVKNALLWLAGLAIALTAAVYAISLRRRAFPQIPLAHLSVLGVLFLLVKAWDYRLKTLLLLYSENSAAYGAGYTDVHARWPAYNILAVIVIVCAALLLLNLWRRTWALLITGAGIWLVSLFILGTAYPALVQSIRVRPNELQMESPYITYNISSTLAAFGLDKIEEVQFPVESNLTADTIESNTGTISNIRLWDWRPLGDTYGQLQRLRSYYTFYDVDVERYQLGDNYREVELSLREMDIDLLNDQAKTWVNQHLVYTHGYGAVASPVNEICSEGQPCFILSDIPPKTDSPEMALTRPEIYYGEKTDNYVITGAIDEFDYPLGNDNQLARYQGMGGIRINGFLQRLAFAIHLGDMPILLNSNISTGSKLLFHRNIMDRVETIAPFLWYDGDPYPVIVDGRIKWIQDAYVYSTMYPYAKPDDVRPNGEGGTGVNYMRDGVKIVIDAYDGTTTFYVVNPNEPLIQNYMRIFPDVFVPAAEMPAGLRAHWRYPEDLFRVQTSIYATYHMRDPQVFFSKEDAWNFANETYAGQDQPMQAYYVIMRLPGWDRPEFLLMVPFTPVGRDNMVAWVHVQCDGADYGKLGVFNFPKQSLVYGPMQVEGRINQNPVISPQLTLWDQHGSSVIRGNLLVIPIENSVLYITPIYLQAENGSIPELRRVIVAYGNRIAMAETLDAALGQVLSEAPSTEPEPTEGRTWQEIAQSAQEHYANAQQCLQNADWACYGAEMGALQADLVELEQLSRE